MIPAAEHVLQSSLSAALALLLAWTLATAAARIRHTVWLLASLKFLLPFSLLVTAGQHVGSLTGAGESEDVGIAVRWLSTSWSVWSDPFNGSRTGVIDLSASGWLTAVWAAGAAICAGRRWRDWRRARALARQGQPLRSGREIEVLNEIARPGTARWQRAGSLPIVRASAGVEPGVFGIVRPVLIWPDGLSDRLTDDELRSVLLHEMCHVARRDNLIALVQTAVEILFWFNPVVWWIGGRLIAEREQACDEEVVKMSINRRSYAQALIKVCEFCLTPTQAFVAGVRGSDLSKRIARIVAPARMMPAWAARLLLIPAAALVVAAPLAAGALEAGAQATPSRAPQGASRQVYTPGKGSGVTFPKLVKEVKPNYTRAAMQAKVEGIVGLEAIVEIDGRVKEVTVVRSLDKDNGLDDEAIRTVKEWRFTPGTKDGKPVAVKVEVEMSFTLK
jgi:TonB family protein